MPSDSQDSKSAHAPSVSPGTREDRFFLLGLLAFGVAISLRQLGDFDLPWHIALGRAVATLRAIPALDPLAYTHQRQTFIEPFSEVPLYLLWKSGGAIALQIAGGVVSAGIGYLLFRPLQGRGPLAYVVVALALAAMNSWLIVRPATLSFWLIALLLASIELHRHGPLHIQRRVLWSWPFLLLFWASAHAFAFIGAGLCLTYAAYRGCCWAARGRLGPLLPSADGSDALATALSALLAAGAAPLNAALGFTRLFPSRFSSDPAESYQFARITENALPSFDFYVHHEPLGPLLLLLALGALLVGRDRAGKRATPSAFDIALVSLGVVGLVWMVRAVPLSVLMLAPVVGRRFAGALTATRLTRWALATTPCLAAGYALLNPAMNLGFGFDATHFPERATAFIERHDVRGHMFNFSPFGGYLALELGPEREVFMDGRLDHARDARLVVRADQASSSDRAFQALVAEFDMQYAVLSAREGERDGVPVARSPEWALVHFDDVAAVYVRVPGPNAALARHGYQVLRHLSDFGAVLQLAAQGGSAAPLLQHDGQLAVAQDPTSARAAFFAACGELAARNQSGFLSALQRLSVLSPGNAAIQLLMTTWKRVNTAPALAD
jgi:hypothetical protein